MNWIRDASNCTDMRPCIRKGKYKNEKNEKRRN